jgi:prophage regulatory protein
MIPPRHVSDPDLEWIGWRVGSAEPRMNVNQSLSQSKPAPQEPAQRIMRLPAVLLATGLTRSTLYRLMAERTFPRPVKIAPRAVGWRRDDVRDWTDSRPTAYR